MLDLNISALGLGTVKFGRNTQVKYPNSFDLPTDKEILKLLGTAKELGVNLLDTAPSYGLSEQRLGQLLPKVGSRTDWVICSKAGETFYNNKSKFDFSANFIITSVKKSLQTLKTDYLDILLIHSDGNDLDIINNHDVFNTINILKKQGLIRYGGMSTKTVAGGILTVKNSDIAMVTYNAEYQDEQKVINAAASLKKIILVKKGFNSGHLAPSKAIEFIFKNPGVTSLIAGTINPQHLTENFHAIAAAKSCQ